MLLFLLYSIIIEETLSIAQYIKAEQVIFFFKCINKKMYNIIYIGM